MHQYPKPPSMLLQKNKIVEHHGEHHGAFEMSQGHCKSRDDNIKPRIKLSCAELLPLETVGRRYKIT